MKSDTFCRLSEMCTSFQGEVNETTDKAFLSEDESAGREVLRGASVCLYAIREASQGQPKYLLLDRFLQAKSKGGKIRHASEPRVGFQRSAPQNNFRRIIAAPIPPGEFCFDTVSYIPQSSSRISPNLLLALLNSQLLEWYFRLGSSNSKLNEYQFDNLPCPRLLSDDPLAGHPIIDRLSRIIETNDIEAVRSVTLEQVNIGRGMTPISAHILERLAEEIRDIENERGRVTKSGRSRLDLNAEAFQAIIDETLFRIAGFTPQEVAGIRERLESLA